MEEFTTNNKFSFKQYLGLQMKILYSKTWIKILTGFSVVYLISYAIFLILHRDDILNSEWYPIGLIVCAAQVYMPVLMFLICLLGFKRNPRIKESIVYLFTESGFTMTGQSFNATFNWAAFYKIQSFKGWLILYQSSMAANFVKLNNDDLVHIQELKSYLQSQNLKVKMRM